MTRSTRIPPACRTLCLLLGLLGAASATRARPIEPESLRTNTPLAAEHNAPSDSLRQADPAASPDQPIDDSTSNLHPLPPRSSKPASTPHTSRRSPITVPEGVWRTIGALGLVVGLIVLLRSAIKRFGGPLAKARAPCGVVEVLGRFPLVRGQTLLLIKIDRRVLLLGQSQQGLTTLCEIADPEQVSALVQRISNDRGDSFSRQFERLITPVRKGKHPADASPTVIDLTQGDAVSAAHRVVSMLADGGRP